jgi:RimJ/RimL family protein N-acetyltransferase
MASEHLFRVSALDGCKTICIQESAAVSGKKRLRNSDVVARTPARSTPQTSRNLMLRSVIPGDRLLNSPSRRDPSERIGSGFRELALGSKMTTFEIPTVATARVRLRAFRAADLDAYTAMQANPEVMRYLVMGRTSTRVEVWRTMATSLGSWLLRGYGMWACEKIDDGAFIGSVGIFQPLDWPEPEIAYSLDQPYWGQGLATEAARAARDWLFEHFLMTRAASFIRPDNHASKRVAQKLGAVCERTFELRGASYEWWVHHRTGGHPDSPLEQTQITI